MTTRQKNKSIPMNELPLETQELLKRTQSKFNLATKYHSHYFGHSPGIMEVKFAGKQIVMVGATLVSPELPNATWASPAEFLLSFLISTLDKAWLQSESQKRLPHEIIIWYKFGSSNIDPDVKEKWYKPNGKAYAILHFSYDLYVLQHNHKLESRLLERIKNKEGFNGARYEAFVFSTLIRAGLKLTYLDETSGKNGKVTECIAEDITGEKVFVEAKTRNVRNVLGASDGNPNKLNLYRNIRLAIEKKPDGPYVIFVDTNFPELSVMVDHEKIKKIQEVFRRIEKEFPNDLPNLFCITNIPFHYGSDTEVPANSAYGFIIPQSPRFQLKKNEILDKIIGSIEKYQYLPKEFNEANVFAEKILAQ